MSTRPLRLALLVSACWAFGCSTGTDTLRTDRDQDPDTVQESEMVRDAATVEDLLRGQVAGVYVRQTPSGLAIRIRGEENPGLSSKDPLFIVDGLPIETGANGALVGLNPEDVESIEVLKNAADTAFYGSRGANGVVVITTRRPPSFAADTTGAG